MRRLLILGLLVLLPSRLVLRLLVCHVATDEASASGAENRVTFADEVSSHATDGGAFKASCGVCISGHRE
ncbi:hypothetical protein [Caballeronia sp. Lep1P3]|uniref:hypothetical protein n=1 Tax=Caballeronia sp. Lep1P3 TaxID=2878150 RepID=UPI00351D0920